MHNVEEINSYGADNETQKRFFIRYLEPKQVHCCFYLIETGSISNRPVSKCTAFCSSDNNLHQTVFFIASTASAALVKKFACSKFKNRVALAFVGCNNESRPETNNHLMCPSIGRLSFNVIFLLAIVLPVSAPARVPRNV